MPPEWYENTVSPQEVTEKMLAALSPVGVLEDEKPPKVDWEGIQGALEPKPWAFVGDWKLPDLKPWQSELLSNLAATPPSTIPQYQFPKYYLNTGSSWQNLMETAYSAYAEWNPRPTDCPHCGRHKHPGPLTSEQAAMIAQHRLDPSYRRSEDTSKIVCVGSDYEGPPLPKGSHYSTPGWSSVVGGEGYTIAALNAVKSVNFSTWISSDMSYHYVMDEPYKMVGTINKEDIIKSEVTE